MARKAKKNANKRDRTERKAAWPRPHPKRGAAYHEIALAFIEAFPLETSLTATEFDAFLRKNGLIDAPPKRESAGWDAHVTKRRGLRRNINKAGMHPRMIERGHATFVLQFMARDKYRVERPEAVLAKTNPAKELGQHCKTIDRRISHMLGAVPLDQHSEPVIDAIHRYRTEKERTIREATVFCSVRIERFDDCERQIVRTLEAEKRERVTA